MFADDGLRSSELELTKKRLKILNDGKKAFQTFSQKGRLDQKGQQRTETEFETNKKRLGNNLPSKKVRNMVAGYITRLKKRDVKLIQE